MASIQERLQRKREPLDKWSIREQLCLSFAVAKVGDQNWMSVSRSLKPFGEGRPGDWFHQKNCAAQYGALLENIDTPKRKKRSSGVEALESPAEIILKKLIKERKAEMKKLMEEERAEYKKLQEEMTLLKSGAVTEEQLDLMCKQIDEEEQQKENEAIAHAEWLKEREKRKADIERAWRLIGKLPSQQLQQTPIIGQKRKASESIDALFQNCDTDTDTPAKPALSPLLTSLLKSPSHAQSVATSSILHSAITCQRTVSISPNSTIASLLNSATTVEESPGIEHLVSSAIAQDPIHQQQQQQDQVPQPHTQHSQQQQQHQHQPEVKDPIDDLLTNADNLDDIENSILSVDGDLPEIKNEEVDVIISDLIENAETHLLDSDDIISNLESELEELDKEEKAATEKELEAAEKEKQEMQLLQQQQQQQPQKTEKIKPPIKEPEIDPFEFQEDPEFEVKLSRSASNSVQTAVMTTSSTPDIQPDSPNEEDESNEEAEGTPAEETEEDSSSISTNVEDVLKKDETSSKSSDIVGGNVEIVEVVVMEDEETSKESNRTQLQENANSNVSTPGTNSKSADSPAPDTKIKEEEVVEAVKDVEVKSEPETNEDDVPSTAEIGKLLGSSTEENATDESKTEVKEETSEDIDVPSRRDTFTPEYSDIFDENIEVTKLDKVGKAKRDYSRTKKKDEPDFDILLPVETNDDDVDVESNASSTPQQLDDAGSVKKAEEDEAETDAGSAKIEEQSHSPWTEEEEPEQEPEAQQQERAMEEEEQEVESTRPHTRRYSTPATPIDSVPNSPASSSNLEDDREYRSLKKSLMLVYSRLSNHKYASLFHRPITNEQAPGYHKLVKRPMDLSTIKKNIESGAMRSTAEFKRDVLLMFHNAIMYNKTDDTVYKMTLEIQQEAVEQIKILLQAQADTPAPARRETRTSEGPGHNKRKRESENLPGPPKSKKRKED